MKKILGFVILIFISLFTLGCDKTTPEEREALEKLRDKTLLEVLETGMTDTEDGGEIHAVFRARFEVSFPNNLMSGSPSFFCKGNISLKATIKIENENKAAVFVNGRIKIDLKNGVMTQSINANVRLAATIIDDAYYIEMNHGLKDLLGIDKNKFKISTKDLSDLISNVNTVFPSIPTELPIVSPFSKELLEELNIDKTNKIVGKEMLFKMNWKNIKWENIGKIFFPDTPQAELEDMKDFIKISKAVCEYRLDTLARFTKFFGALKFSFEHAELNIKAKLDTSLALSVKYGAVNVKKPQIETFPEFKEII